MFVPEKVFSSAETMEVYSNVRHSGIIKAVTYFPFDSNREPPELGFSAVLLNAYPRIGLSIQRMSSTAKPLGTLLTFGVTWTDTLAALARARASYIPTSREGPPLLVDEGLVP